MRPPTNSTPAASETLTRFVLLILVFLGMITRSALANPARGPIYSARSCAAASCHGGPRPGVASPHAYRGSEYQLWLENDPHARSWMTMSGAEAAEILERLQITKRGHVVDQAAYDNCLACHNSTPRYSQDRNDFVAEGVGCSSCHGTADRWIGQHYREDWSSEKASRSGFVRTSDLDVRARKCASCHVGDADRDMNHDIIAAGHPTLRYEFATFHARLPKHWRESGVADAGRHHAQFWLAGQIAAADASLALLHARAKRAHHVNTWPELSAYDCTSCHHRLGRDPTPHRPRRQGTPYSTWNLAGLQWFLRWQAQADQTNVDSREITAALDDLRRIMNAGMKVESGRVAEATETARGCLSAWSDASARQRFDFRNAQLSQVVGLAGTHAPTFDSWESATQFYLAAMATRSSWPRATRDSMLAVALQLRDGLRYPNDMTISPYPRGNRVDVDGMARLADELAQYLLPDRREERHLPMGEE